MPSGPIEDGGTAFPRFVPDGHYNGSVDVTGMSLRDYFAGQALASLDWRDSEQSYDTDADICFRMA